MSKDKYIVTQSLIKFTAYNQTYTVQSSHGRFADIAKHLEAGKTRLAVGAYNDGKKKEVKAGIVIVGNDFFHKGQKMPDVFTRIYQECMQFGWDNNLRSLTRFLDNVVANPSQVVSVSGLANFLEKRRMPVTDRGTFLGYKRINSNWKDCYTSTFDNSVGKIVSMNRADVDHNQDHTCSRGLHVCSYDYLGHYSGDIVVVVEVNPKNVVAVPPDYNGSKLRACEYRVLCTVQEFKAKIASKDQDILGTLPLFKLSQMDMSKHENNGNY